jgi:hypothetical protein
LLTFETSDYAQMRRCRMAHLYAETINEIFESGDGMVPVSGHVHSVRPDLARWPLSWIVSVVATVARDEQPETEAGEDPVPTQDESQLQD